MRIQDFARKKHEAVPISMVTCYDAWSASLIADTDIDCILVGDSVAMVVHGHDTTIPADLATMALHTAAVRRGAPDAFIIGDLPFLSFRRGLPAGVDAAAELMRAGANAVKLEGAAGNLELIQHLVESGVPVMGHVGLTPQSVHQLGGFKVQGRSDDAAADLVAQARELERAGCFAVVLEAIPSRVAARVTADLAIPSIGIGAGSRVDGQVLVLQDLLGLTTAFRPKFVRTWLDGSRLVRDAIQAYHDDVVDRAFPNGEESYR
ncbi:MAG: 3-methyl-2-oxobutanoate hydroxymethyltransferase [Thermoanaerobaculales bacterium]|jgi:3-methyl-2-oxobutanoate hydroxymethyltransferase|nr:3-methyl-2-oxobutanoate hydroxymethyltransferase [Thermoanaerobaculales bacterium]